MQNYGRDRDPLALHLLNMMPCTLVLVFAPWLVPYYVSWHASRNMRSLPLPMHNRTCNTEKKTLGESNPSRWHDRSFNKTPISIFTVPTSIARSHLAHLSGDTYVTFGQQTNQTFREILHGIPPPSLGSFVFASQSSSLSMKLCVFPCLMYYPFPFLFYLPYVRVCFV